MTSSLHECLVSLFRDDPSLVVELARQVYGLRLTPTPERLNDRHAEFAGDARVHLRVYARYIDLVLVIEDPAHPDGGVVIIVEVQLDDDPIKRRRIAGYVGMVVDRHGLPVHIGAVALKDRVSRKLATWTVGTAMTVRSLVFDRFSIPQVKSLETARRRPSMAILSGIVHGHHGDLATVYTALRLARELPPALRQRYTAGVLAALPEQRRAIFMGALPMYQARPVSQLERSCGTFIVAKREGRAEGLAQLVVSVLEVRGLSVTPEQIAEIQAAELATLERWAVEVREVSSAAALLAGSAGDPEPA